MLAILSKFTILLFIILISCTTPNNSIKIKTTDDYKREKKDAKLTKPHYYKKINSKPWGSEIPSDFLNKQYKPKIPNLNN